MQRGNERNLRYIILNLWGELCDFSHKSKLIQNTSTNIILNLDRKSKELHNLLHYWIVDISIIHNINCSCSLLYQKKKIREDSIYENISRFAE